MSSRLRLQKGRNSAAKRKAEQEQQLNAQQYELREQEAYQALQNAQPGTAVTIAGGPPGAHDPFEEADYAPARSHKRLAKHALVSDSESEGSPGIAASAAADIADWSADSEADQGTSSSDVSLDDDDEDSPIPANKGKKATKRNTQSKAKAATAQRSTGKTACKSLPAARNTKQSNPNSLTAARQQPPELASGGRPDTNTKALPVSDKAIAHKPNVDVSRDVISQVKPLPAIPASRPNAGGGVQGSCAPSHMSKPIVFNTTGPLFRAAGLRPPTGSKPLHQIQPQA